MAQVNLNSKELKTFINHIISNNRYLQENNKPPVTIAVEGEAGIGKTTTILELGKEHGLDVVRLNLAEIEELGDLVGFPVKEYEVKRKEDDGSITTKWIPDNTLPLYIQNKYIPSGEKRMTHAVPEWIQGRKEGGLLILDDYTRADQRFMQACMTLIETQSYASWKLPKDWHIILTTNPDNGDYNVTSMDIAQQTRFIKANLKFDIDCWAEWAEKSNLDGRCINFLLLHPELVTQSTNARSITIFFNAISSFSSFEDNLPMIQFIAEGSVGDTFGTMFTMFINNKLDKMISPKKIMTSQDWKDVESELYDTIGTGNNYRADIASTLATRVINYTIHHSENETVNDKFINRVQEISLTNVFTNDIKYHMVKSILNGNKAKFGKLMMNPEIAKMVVK